MAEERSWSAIKAGDKFGRLTVVQFAGKNNRHRPAFYCDCKCGTKNYLADAYGLLNGSVASCHLCRKKQELYGKLCPFPCNSCRRNKKGLCCHECEQEFSCKNACKSKTDPWPKGCGRGES